MHHRLQIFALPLLMVWSFQHLHAADMPKVLLPQEQVKFYAQPHDDLRQILISHTKNRAIIEFNPTAKKITILATNTGDAPTTVSFFNDQAKISLEAALESDLYGTIEFYIKIPTQLPQQIYIVQTNPELPILRSDPCPFLTEADLDEEEERFFTLVPTSDSGHISVETAGEVICVDGTEHDEISVIVTNRDSQNASFECINGVAGITLTAEQFQGRRAKMDVAFVIPRKFQGKFIYSSSHPQ